MSILSKNSIGIDISDHSIEVIELEESNSGIKVLNLGRLIIDRGIVERGRIKDKEKLKKAVTETLVSSRPNTIEAKKLVFTLPESQVYYHFFSTQLESSTHKDLIKEEIRQSVLQELRTNIPMEEEDLFFTYKVLLEEEGKIEVLLLAVSKKTVLMWRDFFEELKIDVDFFDFEMLALGRSILFGAEGRDTNIMVVDMGAEITNIAIFNKRGLNYSHTIDIGGTIFSKNIVRILRIETDEAKEKKMRIGLSDKKNKIFSVLTGSLDPIIKEATEAMGYFQGQRKKNIEAIILVGGSSRLKGVADYFKEKFNLPVFVGGSKLVKSGVPFKHLGAAGSALRGLGRQWEKDPVIDLEKISNSIASSSETMVNMEKKEGVGPKLVSWENKRFQLIVLFIILIIGAAIVGFLFHKR